MTLRRSWDDATTDLANGSIGCLYERGGYRQITLATIDPDWSLGNWITRRSQPFR